VYFCGALTIFSAKVLAVSSQQRAPPRPRRVTKPNDMWKQLVDDEDMCWKQTRHKPAEIKKIADDVRHWLTYPRNHRAFDHL
jgi:hypothetical protein